MSPKLSVTGDLSWSSRQTVKLVNEGGLSKYHEPANKLTRIGKVQFGKSSTRRNYFSC